MSTTYILEAVQLGMRMFQAGLAALANLLPLISVVKYRYLRTPSNVLVACLALSDFLHGLIMLVTYPLRSVSRVWCVISITVESCTVWSQFMNFSLIAIERRCSLLVQLNRSRKWSMKKVIILEILGWLVIGTCHAYFAVNSLEVAEDALCTISSHFMKAFRYVSIGFFVLTTIIIIAYYGAIAKIAYTSSKQVSVNNPAILQQSQKRKADLRITRMMGLVVGVFFAFYLPMLIAMPLMVPSPPVWHHILEHLAINVFDVNFWINPIIYAWRNLRFRKAFKDILSACFPCVGMNGSITGPGTNQSLGAPVLAPGCSQQSNSRTATTPVPLEPRRDIIVIQPASQQEHLLVLNDTARTSGICPPVAE